MGYVIKVKWKNFINLFILISNNKIVMMWAILWINCWKMPYSLNGKLARNVLLYATLRVANRATRNVGEQRRGNEGA